MSFLSAGAVKSLAALDRVQRGASQRGPFTGHAAVRWRWVLRERRRLPGMCLVSARSICVGAPQ